MIIMKCRIYVFVSFFLLTTSLLNAQIGNEIKSYVDSTEILVTNGRKMIVNKIIIDDFSKAQEIYKYLTGLTNGKTISAFYYSEDIYLNILFADWDNLTKILFDYNNSGNKTIYQNSPVISKFLSTKLCTKADSLVSECQKASIDSESKKIVKLIIHVIKNGADDQYSKKLTEFNKEYPNSRYEVIIRNFLPPKRLIASINFGLGSGIISTTGNLKNSFGSNATINMSMDFNIQKVFTSLYLNGTSLKLKTPFTATNGTEISNFNKNESFQYLDAGLRCGYFILRNGKINISPYASISGSFIKSNRYDDPDNDKKEYDVFNSFTFGPGIHSEVKLTEFRNANLSYYYGYGKSYLSLKADAGYNFLAKHNDNYFKGNTPYIMVELIWGMGDF